MASSPNSPTILAIWTKEYQITHYTQPVFRAFATERLKKELSVGDTVHRDYISDFLVNDLGGDGAYSTQGFTDTDETLVVNAKKEVSMQIPEWQKIQQHLPTARKFAQKAMNRLWNQIDAVLLGNMITSAANIVDDGSIGGVAGNPIVISTGNVMSVFSAADTALLLSNVKYVPNKGFTGDVKKDGTDLMSCAAISPQVYQALTQFVGGKNSSKGDDVTTNGYVGYFFGFNTFVSNNLLWEGQLAMSVVPTANDTFTLLSGVTINSTSQALVFTFKASPAAAGDLVVADTAAHGATNVVAALNAPYTTIANTSSAGYYPLVKANLTYTQQYLLANMTASVVSSTTAKLLVTGYSSVPVSTSFTSASNKWAKQVQHNLLGTSQSIDLVMQKTPNLSIRPVSGKLADDYVTWNLFGYKVFNDQVPQLVDVQIDASVLTASPTVKWA